MPCPLLTRSHPAQCRAVAGGPFPVTRQVIAAWCRGPFETCPAYRFVKATGQLANPADFRAWILRGVPPGKTDPAPDAPTEPYGP
jgi:hypothetical protein